MFQIVPAGVVCLVLVAAFRSGKSKGMTPDRKALFHTYLSECKDPAELRRMATVFQREGLKGEALALEIVAKRQELPQAVKDQRRTIFRQTLQSKDPVAVENMAKVFEQEYCLRAARELYEYARGLRGVPASDDAYITEAPAEEKPQEETPKVRVEPEKAPAEPVTEDEKPVLVQKKQSQLAPPQVAPQVAPQGVV